MGSTFVSQHPVGPVWISFFPSHYLTSFYNLLWFPLSPVGHDLAEVVSVTPYFYAEDQVQPCEGATSFQYLKDVAQEAAEYLSAHRDQLSPQSCQEVLKRFPIVTQGGDEGLSAGQSNHDEQDMCQAQSSAEAGLRQLDEKITQAMANMDYPQQWRNTDSQTREGNKTGNESVSHIS